MVTWWVSLIRSLTAQIVAGTIGAALGLLGWYQTWAVFMIGWGTPESARVLVWTAAAILILWAGLSGYRKVRRSPAWAERNQLRLSEIAKYSVRTQTDAGDRLQTLREAILQGRLKPAVQREKIDGWTLVNRDDFRQFATASGISDLTRFVQKWERLSPATVRSNNLALTLAIISGLFFVGAIGTGAAAWILWPAKQEGARRDSQELETPRSVVVLEAPAARPAVEPTTPAPSPPTQSAPATPATRVPDRSQPPLTDAQRLDNALYELFDLISRVAMPAAIAANNLTGNWEMNLMKPDGKAQFLSDTESTRRQYVGFVSRVHDMVYTDYAYFKNELAGVLDSGGAVPSLHGALDDLRSAVTALPDPPLQMNTVRLIAPQMSEFKKLVESSLKWNREKSELIRVKRNELAQSQSPLPPAGASKGIGPMPNEKIGDINVNMGNQNTVGNIGHTIVAPPRYPFGPQAQSDTLRMIPKDKPVNLITVGNAADQAIGSDAEQFLKQQGYSVTRSAVEMHFPVQSIPFAIKLENEKTTFVVTPSAR